MGGILFLPLIWGILWFENATIEVMWQCSAIWLIAYFTLRIIANIVTDRDAQNARIWNSRKHFGRPSFRCWVDKNGKLNVVTGPNPDHATRCQNSLRDWHKIQQRIKWNNWIYASWIFILVLGLNKL
jgi:hypothetical protein